MSKESCKILSQFAKNTAPMSIKRLELYNNMSGDEGAIAIAEVIACCPHLEVFRWASNRSNEEGARALCTSLQQCHAIRRLEFKDNYFGESGGEFLSQALVEMPQLSELVLADLMIEEEGLIPVFRTLQTNEIRLRILNVSLNCMSSEALEALMAILPEQTALEELDVGGNYFGSLSCCVAVFVSSHVATGEGAR